MARVRDARTTRVCTAMLWSCVFVVWELLGRGSLVGVRSMRSRFARVGAGGRLVDGAAPLRIGVLDVAKKSLLQKCRFFLVSGLTLSVHSIPLHKFIISNCPEVVVRSKTPRAIQHGDGERTQSQRPRLTVRSESTELRWFILAVGGCYFTQDKSWDPGLHACFAPSLACPRGIQYVGAVWNRSSRWCSTRRPHQRLDEPSASLIAPDPLNQQTGPIVFLL
jgi:hypothetical protein